MHKENAYFVMFDPTGTRLVSAGGDGKVQVSRAAVVHLDAVREAKPHTDGAGQIVLSNGTTLEVSRRRWRPLLDELER